MKLARSRTVPAAIVFATALLCLLLPSLPGTTARAQPVPAVKDGTPAIDQAIAAGQFASGVSELDRRRTGMAWQMCRTGRHRIS
jgi:hypothetical protein